MMLHPIYKGQTPDSTGPVLTAISVEPGEKPAQDVVNTPLNRGRVTVPLFHSVPLFHYLCLPNLHIIYGCCSLTAPILFSLHIDK